MRFISNSTVIDTVGMGDAITVIRRGLAQWGGGAVANGPRQRIAVPGRSLNVMSAIHGVGDAFGVKAYYPHADNIGGHILLYRMDGTPLAVFDADMLGRLRTGAMSAIATDFLTASDADDLAVIGSGVQAFTQVEAIASVRTIRAVRVFSPTADNRRSFCNRIEAELGIGAVEAISPVACVEGARIVVTATKSATPVLERAWLASDAHVNAIGANALSRRELDDQTILEAQVRVVDDRAQAEKEAAEYVALVKDGRLAWSDVVELGQLVREGTSFATRHLTVFKSLGIAFADIALAKWVFDKIDALEGDGP